MDTGTLITNLNHLFCSLSKEGRVYSKVWLEDVDFGGLYQSDKYILNVKAHHKIDNCGSEIDYLIDILNERAKEELRSIWRVSIYHANENVRCDSTDLIVFEEEKMCP